MPSAQANKNLMDAKSKSLIKPPYLLELKSIVYVKYRLGAFCGVNYKRYPFYAERVKLMTDGEGVDVILDPVLSTFFNCNLECLGMDARWVIYGAMGGVKIKEANMLKLMNKRASILTSILRTRTDDYKGELI